FYCEYVETETERKDLRRLFTECKRSYRDCPLFDAGQAWGAGFGSPRMGGIVGQYAVESFYSGQCDGAVRRTDAGSVAGLFDGEAETYPQDESLARHIIV